MDKKPAKIKALVEIEFEALTTDRKAIHEMVKDKLQEGVRKSYKVRQFHILDHGDFPQTFDH